MNYFYWSYRHCELGEVSPQTTTATSRWGSCLRSPCLIATALGSGWQFGVPFGTCAALAVTSLLLATTSRILFIGALACAGFRFAFAFLVTQQILALALALMCVLLVWILMATAPADRRG
jgi:hypothetical protein